MEAIIRSRVNLRGRNEPKSKFLKALQKLQAVAEKQTTIAVIMAFVAMLGMVTAYRTATAE